MDNTRQPTFSARGGQGREEYISDKYVSVLPPHPAVNSAKQDDSPVRPTLFPPFKLQRKEAPLPRRLSQNTPPQKSRYVDMLLGLDKIPRLHNLFANVFTWLTLAGYIFFPGTFTSLEKSSAVRNAANKSQTGRVILNTVQNVPLLWVAGSCCGIGAVGIAWLWWRWNGNFVWLVNRIFLPSLVNATVGLINTLINVYSAQHGKWSVTATITAVMTGTCAGISLVLFLVYNNWLLDKVKRGSQNEMSQWE